MKKYLITSLLFFIPFMAIAADHCTNPSEYTIDKRCYVTDEQKKTKPYNAVVALIQGTWPYGTGTIVRGKNNKPYLYTARHCVSDKNGLPKTRLRIKLQDGRELDVDKNNVGNYSGDVKDYNNDWAIYSINRLDVPMVEKSSNIRQTDYVNKTDNEIYDIGAIMVNSLDLPNYGARLVGYGALNIMSDQEISQFKQGYIEYLKNNKNIKSNGSEAAYGFYDGGVATSNKFVVNFMKDTYYGAYVYDQKMLKVSQCGYSSKGKTVGCQQWGGNSGGPIFDNNNAIMGIVSTGNRMIGGKSHAGSGDNATLLKDFRQKAKDIEKKFEKIEQGVKK